jgi:hypothetical protein
MVWPSVAIFKQIKNALGLCQVSNSFWIPFSLGHEDETAFHHSSLQSKAASFPFQNGAVAGRDLEQREATPGVEFTSEQHAPRDCHPAALGGTNQM